MKNKLFVKTVEAEGCELSTTFGGRLIVTVDTKHSKIELIFDDDLADELTTSLNKRREHRKVA